MPPNEQLVPEVDVRGGDDGIDARPLGVPHRLGRGLDVVEPGARQAADDRPAHLARDLGHGQV
jgi:hypothetical protein